MANNTKNVCIIEGEICSEIRLTIDPDRDRDQADFWITSYMQTHQGKVITQKILCRVIGDMAWKAKELKEGHRVVLDGRVKYKDYLGFVEASHLSF